jgi:hypothetical protein
MGFLGCVSDGGQWIELTSFHEKSDSEPSEAACQRSSQGRCEVRTRPTIDLPLVNSSTCCGGSPAGSSAACVTAARDTTSTMANSRNDGGTLAPIDERRGRLHIAIARRTDSPAPDACLVLEHWLQLPASFYASLSAPTLERKAA